MAEDGAVVTSTCSTRSRTSSSGSGSTPRVNFIHAHAGSNPRCASHSVSSGGRASGATETKRSVSRSSNHAQTASSADSATGASRPRPSARSNMEFDGTSRSAVTVTPPTSATSIPWLAASSAGTARKRSSTAASSIVSLTGTLCDPLMPRAYVRRDTGRP